jgi:hypothetical protein
MRGVVASCMPGSPAREDLADFDRRIEEAAKGVASEAPKFAPRVDLCKRTRPAG